MAKTKNPSPALTQLPAPEQTHIPRVSSAFLQPGSPVEHLTSCSSTQSSDHSTENSWKRGYTAEILHWGTHKQSHAGRSHRDTSGSTGEHSRQCSSLPHRTPQHWGRLQSPHFPLTWQNESLQASHNLGDDLITPNIFSEITFETSASRQQGKAK